MAETKVISIAIQKGGSGKTTTATNFSAGLVKHGYKVLLIDLDHQANATSSLGVDPSEYATRNICHLLVDDSVQAEQLIIPTDNKVDLIPSNPALKFAEKDIEKGNRKITALKIKLKPLIAIGKYDFIIIDTPPKFDTLMTLALASSDEVIIPIQSEFLAQSGTQQFIDDFNNLNKDLIADDKKPIKIAGALLTMYDSRNRLCKEAVSTTREDLPAQNIYVFNTIIRRNARLGECPAMGLNIFDYDPASIGAKDYEELINEYLKKENISINKGV